MAANQHASDATKRRWVERNIRMAAFASSRKAFVLARSESDYDIGLARSKCEDTDP